MSRERKQGSRGEEAFSGGGKSKRHRCMSRGMQMYAQGAQMHFQGM